jgi:hypothetical protein
MWREIHRERENGKHKDDRKSHERNNRSVVKRTRGGREENKERKRPLKVNI